MNWEKIFSLVDRVGGKHFIVDKDKEKIYVIMGLDEYEQQIAQDDFVDLSENNDFIAPEIEQAQEPVLDKPIKDKAVVEKEDEQFYIEPLE
ncbi:hypothetical protein HY932_00420 [Candidatus Falkowbacteria bacterium]|nr:hypothetical protein [Candidatus Falkowbacteria bacterium]